MGVSVLIAHAKGEEALAEVLAAPIRAGGYEVVTGGSVMIGQSVIGEFSKVLAMGGPVVVCATVRGVGTGWARSIVNAARAQSGTVPRVFVEQMEQDADVDLLSMGTKVSAYWRDPSAASAELMASLKEFYPLIEEPNDAGKKADRPLDFSRYLSALNRRYRRLDLEGLTPPEKEEYLQIELSSVFVEPHVRENPPPVELPKELSRKLIERGDLAPEEMPRGMTQEDVRRAKEAYFGKPTKWAIDALVEPNTKHAVVLGDPGSGKSTLAKYILLSLIDDNGDGRIRLRFAGCIPFMIELRQFAALRASNKCDTFLQFLGYVAHIEGWGLTQDELSIFFEGAGPAVVIFDGLDEIFDPFAREETVRHLAGFASNFPETTVLVTSRVIGYRRKHLTNAGFTHFTLQDLDRYMVERFVRRWYEIALNDRPEEKDARMNRILRAYDESSSLRLLAGNPMLLTILAIIGKHQELPRERWRLYETAGSVLIQHWDVNKHLKDHSLNSEFIGEEDKTELLRRIAYRMQRGTGGLAGNHIGREMLQKEFESYLMQRYDQAPTDAKVLAARIIDQLRYRNFILSLYGGGIYGFVHRAFLEYFCATAFLFKFEKAQELSLDDLIRFYDKRSYDRNWHEVLRLTCAMLHERFAGQVISHLASARVYEVPLGRLPVHQIALAVQCLADIRNLSKLVEPAKEVLYAMLRVFAWDFRYGTDDPELIDREFLPYIEAIGATWPDRPLLRDWLIEMRRSGVAVRQDEALGTLVGSLGHGSKEIHDIVLSFARGADPWYRALAPHALLRGWRDEPSTPVLLRDLAENDPEQMVRRVAIPALAAFWREDASTPALLMARARGEENTPIRLRCYAVSSLADFFSGHHEVLPMLRCMATQEQDELLRSCALSALGRVFYADRETLGLLTTRAGDDPSPLVRSTAIATLASHFPGEETVYRLVSDRATNDPVARIRHTALRSLAQDFPSDPITLCLIARQARADPDPEVRAECLLMLAEHFPRQVETITTISEAASVDESALVRAEGVSLIADFFHCELGSFELVLEKARVDPSPSGDEPYGSIGVRGTALKFLVVVWPQMPETIRALYEAEDRDPAYSVHDLAHQFLSRMYPDLWDRQDMQFRTLYGFPTTLVEGEDSQP